MLSKKMFVLYIFIILATFSHYRYLHWKITSSICKILISEEKCESTRSGEVCNGANFPFDINDPCNLKHLLSDAFTAEHLRMFQEHCDLAWYTRSPKSGSTAVSNVFHSRDHTAELCKGRFLSSNSWTPPFMEEKEVRAIVSVPNTPCLISDTHHFFVPFKKYHVPQPLIINQVRHPITRTISHYFYMSFRMGITAEDRLRSNVTLEGTLSDCAEGRFPLEKCNSFFGYFCENETLCRPRTQAALNIAISNIENYGMIIGLAEDIDGFFEVLELLSPKFFRDSRKIYNETKAKSTRMSSNKYVQNTIMLDTKDVMQLPIILDTEIQLYMFIRQRYYAIKDKLYVISNV